MTTVGRVRVWHAEEGWGVLDSTATPGGCWAHFSSLLVPGYASLTSGQEVTFTFGAVEQDGFGFRAVEVWPADRAPVRRAAEQTRPSAAYRSSMSVHFDDEPGQ